MKKIADFIDDLLVSGIILLYAVLVLSFISLMAMALMLFIG